MLLPEIYPIQIIKDILKFDYMDIHSSIINHIEQLEMISVVSKVVG